MQNSRNEKTKKFQQTIENKMSEYFRLKFTEIRTSDPDVYSKLITEYDKQYKHVVLRYKKRTRYFAKKYIHEAVLLSAISEPKTAYTLDDFCHNGNDRSYIYSPRIDIAFSPIVSKSRGKHESIGIYTLTKDVTLLNNLHTLAFVKKVEFGLREISNSNLEMHNLKTSKINIYPHYESNYINKRPLHLFGIEIENQSNNKHLMGDFLNVISLSRIPIVVVPENKFESLMKMLKFSSTIIAKKKVPIYELLQNVNILTVAQFRNLLNTFLVEENISPIEDNGYN